jgi:exodeoxyribonuclease V alpha subunit
VNKNNVDALSGAIERVTFHQEDSGFCVLKVKAIGQRELVTVIGNAVSVTAGEYVDCTGSWVNNREYGLQFKADQLRVVMPSTLAGIEKYLGSGLVKGIGPHFAKVLVDAFKEQVFDIIETEPDRLLTLPGIGEYRRDRVMKSWQDQKMIRQIVVFLHSHGVGTARAVRIYKTYGQKSIEKVRENPYRLALDIRGIGFKTADVLAERLGISKQSLIRAEAGVRHVLQEHSNDGHCAMFVKALIKAAVELLEIPESIILEAMQTEIMAKRLVQETIGDEEALFLAAMHRAEVGIVSHLKRLQRYTSVWMKEIDVQNACQWVEKRTQLQLSLLQETALKTALQHKIVIITGGPGVGKTTLINSILQIVKTKTKHLVLAAPTGRAAKRLSDSAGLEAKTLHRLLEFDPNDRQFKRNEHAPLEADLVVVDEMSMVDVNMMYQLLRAIPDTSALLLIGDVDQLPSVGAGAVLANLIESETIPTVRLTEIFRQAKTSQIIVNAHAINRGKMPEFPVAIAGAATALSDFYFIEADAPETIQDKLIQVVVDRIPRRFGFDPIRQIQVLVPMNRGGLGARALNVTLQSKLNPTAKNAVSRFGSTYAEGDKVIQTVNNYNKEVFNGDIGFITDIDIDAGLLHILFEGRLIEYELDELDEISLAYATTIHKAQGSEYPAIVIPLAMQHFMLLERNLLYTGVTRGKSLVVIIGQYKALGMAVRTLRSSKRLTHLRERLFHAFTP